MSAANYRIIPCIFSSSSRLSHFYLPLADKFHFCSPLLYLESIVHLSLQDVYLDLTSLMLAKVIQSTSQGILRRRSRLEASFHRLTLQPSACLLSRAQLMCQLDQQHSMR